MRFLRPFFTCLTMGSLVALRAASVTISLSPTSVTVNQGAAKTFTVTVKGSTNTAVTWSVTSGGGSITTAGVYTAPAKAGTYTVTATSKADTTKKATATITVPMKVTVSPGSVSLSGGGTTTFAATVTGATNKAVTWSVSSGGGRITSAGVYTAPFTAGTYTVTATTQATPVAAATATVSVTAATVAVVIAPTTASVPISGTKSFTATVTGATIKTVTWKALLGSITSSGGYTAPPTIGTDTVTATSVADPTKSASASIRVTPALSINPGAITLNQGEGASFSAAVIGATDPSVTWSATAGAIDGQGDFTAPNVAGIQTITATSVADPTVSATAKATVRSVGISITPSSMSVETASSTTLPVNGSYGALTTKITGTFNTKVQWSIASGGGSLQAHPWGSGYVDYFAPNTPGTVVLRATSVADPTKSATATLTVTQGTAPTINSFLATPSRVQPGGTTQLSANFGNGTGSLTPGGIAMTSGLPIAVTPNGSTRYTLTLNGMDGTVISQSLTVGVAGPGVFSSVQEYPSHFLDYYGGDGTPIQVVVTRDGTVLGIGCRSTYSSGDVDIYRFDLVTQSWSSLGVLPGQGKVIRFRALPLPDGNVAILTTLSATYGSQQTALDHISSIYLVSPTGVVLGSKNLSSSSYFGINGSLSLLPDGRLLVAGGKMLPYGTSYCYYGLGCDEPKNWITYIDPTTFIITNPAVTLNHARANHSAIPLQDGRILFVGGGSPVLEIFDPTTETCTDVGTLNGSSAQAVMQGDGRVLCLGAGPGQNAIFDPSNSSLTFVPDFSGDGGFNPTLLDNGLVLADLARSDVSLWDPTRQVRLGTQNASDSVYFDSISINPALLPDGTMIGGSYSRLARFDPQPALNISPVLAQENAGRVTSFQVMNPNGASIIWSASGGTMDASGHFSAPSPGTYVVTATASDGRKAVATVNAWPKVRVNFAPLPVTVHPSGKNWLQPGDSIQVTGTVKNHADQTISWSLPSGTTGVSVTPAGLLTALAPGKFTVLATPAADPTQVASLVIRVWPADLQPPQFISAAAAPLEMTSLGGPLAVTWQLSTWGLEDGAFDIGMADSYLSGSYAPFSGLNGTYKVPSASGLGNGAVVTHYYTLKASNPAGTAQANFIVHVHGEYLRIIPNEMSIRPGQSQPFSYVLQYDPQTPRVNWTALNGGSVDANGLYIAPTELGYYYLQAASADNPAITAIAKITVADPAISISPTSVSLFAGEQMRFGYSLTGTPETDVYWRSPGGIINPPGDYKAPSWSGMDSVTVYGAYGTVSATATVTVKPISVHLSPVTQSLQLGSTLQFACTTDFGGVTWSATGGTISPTGLYTPPTTPGTYQVTAVSTSGLQYRATATIKVVAPTIALSPSTLSLTQASTFQFTYSSSSGGVNWSASGGTISGDGFYTAPSGLGTYIITATSAVDPAVSVSSYVTVTLAPNKGITLTPPNPSVFPGATTTFKAVVVGLSDPTVSWSVLESNGGSMGSSGVYSAPTIPGIYTIQAASLQDPTVKATTKVVVSSVEISPGPTKLLAPRFTQTFTPTLAPGAMGPVAWSVDEGLSGGQVSSDGLYTAPSCNGTFHIRGTLPDGNSNTVEVQVGQIQDVVIGIPIQVSQAGNFRLSASLIGSNGKSCGSSIDLLLPLGESTPELVFHAADIKYAIGANGPWTVGNVELTYLDTHTGEVFTADHKDTLGDTSPWALDQLRQPWASLTGAFQFSGIGDGAGAFLGIQTEIGVKLMAPGTYYAFAILEDAHGDEVAVASSSALILPAGVSTLSLTFPGSSIKASGLGGPYVVTGLVVSGQEVNAFEQVGTVTGFKASDF